jgi:hypothetical protein
LKRQANKKHEPSIPFAENNCCERPVNWKNNRSKEFEDTLAQDHNTKAGDQTQISSI